MPQDFDHWSDKLVAEVRGEGGDTQPPDLLRPLAELEADYRDRARNLYPMDPEIPRGPKWDEEIERIMQLTVLPSEYAASPVWRHAHALHSQIRAFKGDPNVVMWHPV